MCHLRLANCGVDIDPLVFWHDHGRYGTNGLYHALIILELLLLTCTNIHHYIHVRQDSCREESWNHTHTTNALSIYGDKWHYRGSLDVMGTNAIKKLYFNQFYCSWTCHVTAKELNFWNSLLFFPCHMAAKELGFWTIYCSWPIIWPLKNFVICIIYCSWPIICSRRNLVFWTIYCSRACHVAAKEFVFGIYMYAYAYMTFYFFSSLVQLGGSTLVVIDMYQYNQANSYQP